MGKGWEGSDTHGGIGHGLALQNTSFTPVNISGFDQKTTFGHPSEGILCPLGAAWNRPAPAMWDLSLDKIWKFVVAGTREQQDRRGNLGLLKTTSYGIISAVPRGTGGVSFPVFVPHSPVPGWDKGGAGPSPLLWENHPSQGYLSFLPVYLLLVGVSTVIRRRSEVMAQFITENTLVL